MFNGKYFDSDSTRILFYNHISNKANENAVSRKIICIVLLVKVVQKFYDKRVAARAKASTTQ